MNLRNIAATGGVIVACSLSNFAARAEVLYDNLSAVSGGADPVLEFGPLYDSFSTGSAAVELTQISLLLYAILPGDDTFTINVYNNVPTSPPTPGSAIDGGLVFFDASLTTAPSPFTTSAAFALAADTRYWIGLSTTGSVYWEYSSDSSGTGVASEYFNNANGTSPNIDGPYQMELIGGSTPTTVPEPSAWAMMLIGFAGLGVAGYHGSRKRAAAQAL